MRIVRIVTWNLGYWQFRKQHHRAWEYLRWKIAPDIGLLQECKPPALLPNEKIFFEEVHRGWGTAIYLRDIDGERIELTQYPGRVAAAKVQVTKQAQWHVASIHAPIIQGRVFPHLDKLFQEIESKFASLPSVVGGDLNSARLAEKVWPGYGHGPFFEKIDGGQSWFVDCRAKFHDSEIQTFFRKGQKHPFQDDHIFVSRDLAEKVVSYNVLKNETTLLLSDHLPVLIEISI